MSIKYTYIAVEWKILDSLPRNGDFAGFLFDQIDSGADWLAPVSFGAQIDHYHFESGEALMLFNEWFLEVKDVLSHEPAGQFSRLFTDCGLLFSEETLAPQPISADLGIASDWLIAAIPPEDTLRLTALAESIDLDRCAQDFQRALDQLPCEVVSGGDTLRNWIAALRDGLRSASAAGRGIIMGAA